MYTHVSVRMYRCCVGSLCMYFQFCLFFVIVCVHAPGRTVQNNMIFVYDFENHNYYLHCCAVLAVKKRRGKGMYRKTAVGRWQCKGRGNAVAVKGTVDGLPSGICDHF